MSGHRQNMRVSPSHKHMHIYQDFSGGLNTIDADEKLLDRELPDLLNVDIGERGSLKRRSGHTLHIPSPLESGKGQGYFRFFQEGEGYKEIIAVDGQLFEKDGTKIPIEGLEDGFQKDRPIQAVQFRDKLYIATGTRLVSYDGETAKVVEPYRPQPLEALYIGTNGLADNPDDFMQDGEASTLRFEGITFSRRYGIINEPTTMTAYISKPSDMDVVYKFEGRSVTQAEGMWETLQDWSESNEHTFTPTFEGDLQFRVWVMDKEDLDEESETFSDWTAHQYIVPKYKVRPAKDPNDEEVNTDTIHSCNRILLHWNRLILYGDTTQPDAIFISHLNNPAYFPIPNSLIFESRQRDPITSIVRFRDHLVVFTKTSIQALFGKSPSEYQRFMQNSTIGCIAPETAKVVENYVYFLSNEGVHVLKSLAYNENKANVEKIDNRVKEHIHLDQDASAVVQNNQYHLVYPSRKERLRFYYKWGVWTKDESNQLDVVQMENWDGKLYALRENGGVLVSDSSRFDDNGHVYETRISTKYYDFGEPYHEKKLRELQMILGGGGHRTKASVEVYVDNKKIIETETMKIYPDEEGNIIVEKSRKENVIIVSGTVLGEWVLGESPFGEISSDVYKLRLRGRGKRLKVIITHKENSPIQLLGVGMIFKVKAP